MVALVKASNSRQPEQILSIAQEAAGPGGALVIGDDVGTTQRTDVSAPAVRSALPVRSLAINDSFQRAGECERRRAAPDRLTRLDVEPIVQAAIHPRQPGIGDDSLQSLTLARKRVDQHCHERTGDA